MRKIVKFNGYFYEFTDEIYYRCKSCHKKWRKDRNKLVSNQKHEPKCRREKYLKNLNTNFENEDYEDLDNQFNETPINKDQKSPLVSSKNTTISNIKVFEEKIKNFQISKIQHVEKEPILHSNKNPDGKIKIKFLRDDFRLANVKHKFGKAEQLFSKEVKDKLVDNINLGKLLNEELENCDKAKYSLGFMTLYGIAFIIKDSNAPFKFKDLKRCLQKIEVPKNQRFILKERECDKITFLQFNNMDIIYCITKGQSRFGTYKEICLQFNETRRKMFELSKKYEDWVELDFKTKENKYQII